MDYQLFKDSFLRLEKVAHHHPDIVVLFSAGKDSLVCLDMATKVFRKVVPVFLYLLPGLKVIEDRLKWAEDRYQIKVQQFPHWTVFMLLRDEIYRDYNKNLSENIFAPTMQEMFMLIMHYMKSDYLIHGGKKSDSIWRRRFFNFEHDRLKGKILYPLMDWMKYDVLAYLRLHHIPIPDTSKGNATGVGLNTPSLCWLHDKYPDDFMRLLEWFPYAEAVIKRREYYGIG